MLSKTAVGVAPPSSPFAVSFVSTGLEYVGLVGVALQGRNLLSFHPSWAITGRGVGVFPSLTGRGSEVDLVMVMCTLYRFPALLGVEMLNGNAGIFQVFCRVLLTGFLALNRIRGDSSKTTLQG